MTLCTKRSAWAWTTWHINVQIWVEQISLRVQVWLGYTGNKHVFRFVTNFNKHYTECEAVSGNLFSNSKEGLYSKKLVSYGTMVLYRTTVPQQSVLCGRRGGLDDSKIQTTEGITIMAK